MNDDLNIKFHVESYFTVQAEKNQIEEHFMLVKKDETKEKIITEMRDYMEKNNITDDQAQNLIKDIQQTMSTQGKKKVEEKKNNFSQTSRLILVIVSLFVICLFLFMYFSRTTTPPGVETNNKLTNETSIEADKQLSVLYRDPFSLTRNETIVGILGTTLLSQIVHQVGISNQTETYQELNLTLEETKNQTATLLPQSFEDIKMFFKLNFLKKYNQSIFDTEEDFKDFLVDGKVEINNIKKLNNVELNSLNDEIGKYLKNLPEINKTLTDNLDLGIIKETIENNWNTASFSLEEMMDVVNDYYANKNKFPPNQNIPKKEEIKKRLIDSLERINNKSLFGFGYLKGLGYGILTSEDKIKIDETLQIFSQMKKAVEELSKEMEDKEKKIKENIQIQTKETAHEKDKNALIAKNEERQRNKLNRNRKKEINKRNTGQYPKNYIKIPLGTG